MRATLAFSLIAAISAFQAFAGERIAVHAQAFDAGGWQLDVQFMDEIGSPCLLAHGAGVPVGDARATVTIPEAGEWRVRVRAKNWADGAPGAFRVRIGSETLSKTFGVSERRWTWEDGGTITLAKGETTVQLRDLTGFDGRFAGLVLEKGDGLLPLDGPLSLSDEPPVETVTTSFCIVGGGLPGCAAALAAARSGVRTVLLQDRPYLGGNASREVRIWCAGEGFAQPIIHSLRGQFYNGDAGAWSGDDRRLALLTREDKLDVRLSTRAFAVTKTTDGRIASVKAIDWKRNRVIEVKADLFLDSTGDGWIGAYAGADWRMGREAKSETGESMAPERADGDTLGASLVWSSRRGTSDVPFSAPWAEPHACGVKALAGDWNWEYGIHRDMVADAEGIRDRLLLAIYGSFSLAKKDPANARNVLDCVPFILGKRESRRLMGDYIFSEKDVVERIPHADAIAKCSWAIDLHYDDVDPKIDFQTRCTSGTYGRSYVPFRSIYSRNVPNLMMAGRCFSCTHVGLGSPRVINTLAQMGVAAGYAASICGREKILPRELGKRGLVREIQRLMGGDWPDNPDPAHASWVFVDDEDDGVVFGKGWVSAHMFNGEQFGEKAHVAEWKTKATAEPAVYPLPVRKAGRYRLYAKTPFQPWPPEKSVGDAALEIVSGGRTIAVSHNQYLMQGTWRTVGTFDLQSGALLRILPAKSTAQGDVFADGFAIEPLEPSTEESLVAGPIEIGGIYPSLAYSNDEGECGTGAVVPWAGSLWVVTYGPHCPIGGSDKLHQITPTLEKIVRPESVGGTHANRLIHRESQQLLIGTYLIDAKGRVRTIPICTMPGRLTGVARHLSDPKNKVYVTDMEEALYELDVNTLETRTLIRDGHNTSHFQKLFEKLNVAPPKGWFEAEVSDLFGYHGKGTCSGFGRVFYANNGLFNATAMRNPSVSSGALAEWFPNDRQWREIRANQFTEITTKDGIYGNEHPETNPIWAMGWDAKSVILSVTTNGLAWTDYRLPKGSHSYDGAHGWNTEWPRIREIGNKETFLATMHGTFWAFPSDFAPNHAKGIRPRSNYLKVIGDFCEWNGKVVLGCDDSAKNEFLNKRSVKGTIKGPARSQSNLRFVDPSELDRMGPPIGTMFVWNREDIARGETSAPHLLAGYAYKWAWVTEGEFAVEIDPDGTGNWQSAGTICAGGNDLSELSGEWLRLTAKGAYRNATVALSYRADDMRGESAANWLTLKLGTNERSLLHVNEIDPLALSLSVGKQVKVKGTGERATLELVDCSEAVSAVKRDAPLKTGVLAYERASILYVDDAGHRWRLPYGSSDRKAFSEGRVCREVCTERDHFNAGGIYYELPAENAHGFAGIRPIATHCWDICDYGSWRGLLAVTLPGELRLMAVDDFWKVGKARGFGGPWDETDVTAGEPSDAYLMNGFDRKRLTLCSSVDTTLTMEVDVTGWGVWVKAGIYAIKAGATRVETLPRALGGYWVRFVSAAATKATAQFVYD